MLNEIVACFETVFIRKDMSHVHQSWLIARILLTSMLTSTSNQRPSEVVDFSISKLDASGPMHLLVFVHYLQKSTNFAAQILADTTLNRLKENFDLTQEEFDQLLSQLKQGDTTLFENVFLKHFQDCMKYLQNRYQAQHDDAYDSTMDTMLSFRNRLVQDKVKYGNMRFLFTQMASQNYIRKMKGQKFAEISEVEVSDDNEVTIDQDDLLILQKAWNRLTPECQQLFRMNYYQGMKLVEVADKLNRPSDTVRKKKERCKKKLIQFFNEHTS